MRGFFSIFIVVSAKKIYVNGKFLTQRNTGVQSYAHGIIAAMKRHHIPFEILTPKLVRQSDDEQVKQIGFFRNNILWEQVSLPFFINKQKDAVLLNFCNSAPLLCKQQIVTIHDLAFEQKNVRWFSWAFKRWYRFLIPKICRSSKWIFTVSDFSRTEIINHYGIEEHKMSVVPNGLNPYLKVGAREVVEDYVLITGGNNPRKNAAFVIRHISEIEAKGLKLVVLNTDDSVFYDELKPLHPSAIYFDYVSETRYYSLIKYSSALIYPSLYEGFGIPILESLCLKTPVICSDLQVFREAFGELPVYFKSNDGSEFKKALEKIKTRVISDSDVEKLQQKYSFDESVSLILNTLKNI
ncbi:MAG: glycosyltransferase family 4 protein [Bacteroidetes bacterium]|nr:glycosyltransferase family 4 protein [Bacteroidota bacterium]